MLEIQKDIKLAEHTRFGIGGIADFFVSVNSAAELAEAIGDAVQNGWDWVLIGEGTNLLVSDQGYRGLVIKFQSQNLEFDEHNHQVTVDAGVNLASLIETLAEKGWSGMESMYGIPGSVGAGVYGNVGAYGTEIKNVLKRVSVLHAGQIIEMDADECKLEYRSSIFKSRKDWLVITATFELMPGIPAEIKKTMDEIMAKRLVKYPAGLKCPGSYFKNIKINELSLEQNQVISEYSAKIQGGKLASGVLLEAVGAKGMKIGGAAVADYHANLIFNTGSATAEDVRELAEQMKKLVLDKFGIKLQEEVQFLGNFAFDQ